MPTHQAVPCYLQHDVLCCWTKISSNRENRAVSWSHHISNGNKACSLFTECWFLIHVGYVDWIAYILGAFLIYFGSLGVWIWTEGGRRKLELMGGQGGELWYHLISFSRDLGSMLREMKSHCRVQSRVMIYSDSLLLLLGPLPAHMGSLCKLEIRAPFQDTAIC